MNFESVAEAFNYYRMQSVEAIEKRAAEISKLIDTDPKADVKSLNIELEGMKEAKSNIESRAAFGVQAKGKLNLITGTAGNEVSFGEDVTASKEYRSAFFKQLLGRALDEVEKRAWKKAVEMRNNVFATSSNTGAVIPTTTLNEVVSKARKIGGLLAESRAFALPSKISIPVGTPSDAASWHTEGATVDSEKPSIASVTFDGNEILKVFSISTKVETMSIDAFESYLVDELVNCVMACVEDALVNGTGSGQGTGLLSGITWDATNSVTVAAADSIAYDNVIEMVALLPRGYANGAKIAMNNATLYRVFYGMLDDNKRPIFIADPKAETIGMVLGFPVVVDDYIPDNTVIMGNFGQYLGYNLPGGIVVEASRESSFKSGLIDYRALAVADCKPIVAEAFVKLEKASA